LPPANTGNISEKGRKKNLDKVFFTKDLKSAKIYADRAKRSVAYIQNQKTVHWNHRPWA